uniref:TP53RK-binding protein n=2 Tax=Meloidogyne incognita group TaxID=654580 RepID=A0A915MXF6_MELJA
MKTGLSKLFELQPDPYDNTQSKFLRICLFTNVENASELREFVRKGEIDAALIRAELLLEPFVLLAAANRAVHQAAHNRMITRSLSAELIYSLSPNRNISDSLNTFGIAENSQSLVVAIFDDVKGKKMISIAKRIKGTPVSFELLREISDLGLIKQIYQLPELDVNGISMSDLIVSRIVTKEIV